MKEREKSFGIFFDWIDDLDHLDGADAWKVIKAIAEYHRSGTNPLDLVDGPLRSVVSIMFHQIKRKERISEMRSEFGKRGGFATAKSQQRSATVTSNSNSNNITLPLQGESNTPAPAHTREEKNAYGEFGNVYLTDVEHADLIERYGDQADDLINNLSRKLRAKGYQYDDHYAAILLWAVQDGITKRAPSETQKSYNLDEFVTAALERSYQNLNTEVSTHG